MSDINSNSNNNKEEDDDEVSPRELIDTIEKLEYALIQLIQITSDGIESVDNNNKEEEYKNITTAYYSLLQRISNGMRNVLESLVQNGYIISSSDSDKEQYIPVYSTTTTTTTTTVYK
ncbi:hypothetical protein MP638_000261 [Amoeboaphelidium occidentale]|nr:hypothetical protein MP638_000261 [Amoeboaphelidium occidentale]